MSSSKTKFGGKEIRRVQRSEFDDSKMREVARHDLKLGHDIKTMERARNVVKKSMDAEKQMFMKTGPQTATKISRSQAPRTPVVQVKPGAAVTGGGPGRFVSDSKSSRKNSDDDPPGMPRVSSTGSLGAPRSGRQSRSPNPQTSDSNNNTNEYDRSSKADMPDSTNSDKTPGSEPSIYDDDSPYAEFLKKNLGSSLTSHAASSLPSSITSSSPKTKGSTAVEGTTTKSFKISAAPKGKTNINGGSAGKGGQAGKKT